MFIDDLRDTYQKCFNIRINFRASYSPQVSYGILNLVGCDAFSEREATMANRAPVLHTLGRLYGIYLIHIPVSRLLYGKFPMLVPPLNIVLFTRFFLDFFHIISIFIPLNIQSFLIISPAKRPHLALRPWFGTMVSQAKLFNFAILQLCLSDLYLYLLPNLNFLVSVISYAILNHEGVVH